MIDLSVAIRSALVGEADITSLLPAWKGTYPVFTRRPVPKDAEYPMIIISPDVSLTDQDMVSEQMPVVVRDIAVYGRNTDADAYNAVEAIAYRIRDLFHRDRFSLLPSGWAVTDVVASGPFQAPTDDNDLTGRAVTLTVRLTQAT